MWSSPDANFIYFPSFDDEVLITADFTGNQVIQVNEGSDPWVRNLTFNDTGATADSDILLTGAGPNAGLRLDGSTNLARIQNLLDAAVTIDLLLRVTKPLRLEGTAVSRLVLNRPMELTGALTISAGTVVIRGANTHTGGTSITQGTVRLEGMGNLGNNIATNGVTVSHSARLFLENSGNLGTNQIVNLVAETASTAMLPILSTSYNGIPILSGTSEGVVGIDVVGFTAVADQAALGNGRVYLGSTSSGTFAAVTLSAGADNMYRLGGGGGVLTIINPVLTGSNGLLIGDARTNGGGTVRLGSSSNDFSGPITILRSTLEVEKITDVGIPQPLGVGSSPVIVGSSSSPDGTFRYSGNTHASLSRDLIIGGSRASIDVSSEDGLLTLHGKVQSGFRAFSKHGAGTLRLDSVGNSFASIAVAGGTLILGSDAEVPAFALGVGNDGATGEFIAEARESLSLTSVRVGSKVSANTQGVHSGIVDLSAVRNLTITGAEMFVAAETTSNAIPGNAVSTGTLVLAANSNITATNSVTVGDSLAAAGQGGGSLVFGSEVTQIATPLITIGGKNYSATATLPAGAKLILQNGYTSTVLRVGYNNAPGSAPTSIMDLSAGVVEAELSTLVIGYQSGNGTGTSTGTLIVGERDGSRIDIVQQISFPLRIGQMSTGVTGFTGAAANGTMIVRNGVLTIAGLSAPGAQIGLFTGNTLNSGSNKATGRLVIEGGETTIGSNSGVAVELALMSSAIQGMGNTAEGILEVRGGRLVLNGDLIGYRTNRSTSTLELSGGLLDLRGNDISNLTNLSFTGGTLRNVGSLARFLAQSGTESAFEVLNFDTAIQGTYLMSGGSATIHPGRTLSTVGISASNAIITLEGFIAGGATTIGPSAILEGGGQAAALILNGGVIQPGSPVGDLHSSSFTSSGGSFHFDINGWAAGIDHDQFAVTGNFTLTGDLQFTLSIGDVPDPGAEFKLIDIGGIANLGSHGFVFESRRLNEGDLFFAQGHGFRISYVGGDGNDVVLTVPEPGVCTLGVLGGATLLGFRRTRRENRRFSSQGLSHTDGVAA